MRRNRRSMAEINVVPYIDVMLVLLVIFMITAPLLSQGVNVELPKAAAKPLTQQKEPLIISINAQGQYFLNIGDRPSEAKELPIIQSMVMQALTTAKARGELQSVFVKGDRLVGYDKVMQAMVLLQHAGADHVGLITQDPS
jgi:biopolymer transport protein TolR